MGRRSFVDDSDIVNVQIRREQEAYSHSQLSPEKKKKRSPRGDNGVDNDGEPRPAKKKNYNWLSTDDDRKPDEPSPSKRKRYGELDVDHDGKPSESSPSKKSKRRNRHKVIQDLYEVAGTQNLPAKRRTSSRIEQIHSATKNNNGTTSSVAVTSYPGSSPFMSPTEALLHSNSENNAPPKPSQPQSVEEARLQSIFKHCSQEKFKNAKSPQPQSVEEARLQSILKHCSQKKLKNMTLAESMALDDDSEDSPSPSDVTPLVIIKKEEKEPGRWVSQLPKNYKNKERQWPCPVDTCNKIYSRKDSLAGHMNSDKNNSGHGGQILHDNGDGSFSIIAESADKDAVTTPLKNNSKGRRSSVADSGDKTQTIITKASKSKGKHTKLVDFSTLDLEEAARNETSDDDGNQNKSIRSVKKSKKKATTKASDKLQEANEKLIAPKAPLSEHSKSPSGEETMLLNHGQLAGTSSSAPIVARALKAPRSSRPTTPVIGNVAMKMDTHSGMEQWEISPGIMATTGFDILTNTEITTPLAYSANHMRTNPAAAEFANVSFATHVVASGGSLGFPLETFSRACYVVSGKVQVRVEDAQFTIGKGGIWRVLGLETCVIGNCSYDDGVIHVTSIKAEE